MAHEVVLQPSVSKTFGEIYREVRERIGSRKSFEETIDRINELNVLILKALAERSQHPICRTYFENSPQTERESKGIDICSWYTVYSPILRHMCEEGDVDGEALQQVIKAESKLEELVCERIMIGENVIKYKAPRGMQITRKDREEDILRKMRGLAKDYGLEEDAVENVFKILMEKNKDLQASYKRCNNIKEEGLRAVRTCRTMQFKPYEPGDNSDVDKIRKGIQTEGEVLLAKPGDVFHTVVEKEDEHTYVIKLIKEEPQ